MVYTVDPSDSRLPPNIGEEIGGDDHDDNPSTATRVSPNSTTSGTISPAGDWDYFQVTVSGSGTLTASATGSMDNVGRLENSSGTVLTSNDDGGPNANFRFSQSVSSGTYYIRVSGWGSSTGDYTLHVSFDDQPDEVDLEVVSASVSNSNPSPRAEYHADCDGAQRGECEVIAEELCFLALG